MAKLLARQQEQDERESLRKLYLDVQTVAARRMHDISMASNREWFHSSVTRTSSSTPGPGSYSLASASFFSESSKSAIEPLGVMAGRPPLLAGLASSPGPAAYHSTTHFLDRYKSSGAVKFNGRPTTFAMDGQSDSPGPAAYLPERIDLRAVHTVPFGLSAVPAREVVRDERAPAPTSYTPQQAQGEVCGGPRARRAPRHEPACR